MSDEAVLERVERTRKDAERLAADWLAGAQIPDGVTISLDEPPSSAYLRAAANYVEPTWTWRVMGAYGAPPLLICEGLP